MVLRTGDTLVLCLSAASPELAHRLACESHPMYSHSEGTVAVAENIHQWQSKWVKVSHPSLGALAASACLPLL